MRRVGVRAGQLPDPIRIEALGREVQLGHRPAVHPDGRRREGSVRGVHGDDPVELRGDTDRGAIGGGPAGVGDRLADRALYRDKPGGGILLRPARPRVGDRRGPRAAPDDRAPVIEEDRLRRLGPDVAADDEDGRPPGQSRMMTYRIRRPARGVKARRGRSPDQPTGPGPRRYTRNSMIDVTCHSSETITGLPATSKST